MLVGEAMLLVLTALLGPLAAWAKDAVGARLRNVGPQARVAVR